MALKGAKVLLVDLDLRKATLSKALDKEHTGIAAYLNGKSADYHAHLDSVSDNLFVIPVGTLPPNPTELLLTCRFGEMMASLRQEYDYIFIDCPPIEVVADAAIITKHTDMTVFVVRSGLLDKRSLPRIKALYESAKYSRMALIVNGIDVEGRRSGYGYGYGYGYGNNE
jgi:capsular exopolysaccharide synthesis family protein